MEAEEILKRFGGVPHRRKKSYSKSSRRFSVSQKTRKLLGLIALLLMTGAVFGTSYLIQNTTLFDRSSAAGESVEGYVGTLILEDFQAGTHKRVYLLNGNSKSKWPIKLDASLAEMFPENSKVKVDNAVTIDNEITSGELSLLEYPNNWQDNDRDYLVMFVNFLGDPERITNTQYNTSVQNLNANIPALTQYFSDISDQNLDVSFRIHQGIINIDESIRDLDGVDYTCISTTYLKLALDQLLKDGYPENYLDSFDSVIIINPDGLCGNGAGGFLHRQLIEIENASDRYYYVLAIDGSDVLENWTQHLTDYLIPHEILHNLGFDHAARYSCNSLQSVPNCAIDVYGNLYDMLGDPWFDQIERKVGISSYHKEYAGWINVTEIFASTQTVRFPPAGAAYKIYRQDIANASGGTSKEYIYLEKRGRVGVDQHLHPSVDNGVFIMFAPFADVRSRDRWWQHILVDMVPYSGEEETLDDKLNALYIANTSFIDPVSGIRVDVKSDDQGLYAEITNPAGRASSYRGTQGTYDEFVDDGTAQGETLGVMDKNMLSF